MMAVRTFSSAQAPRKRRDIALILPDNATRIAVLDFDNFPSDPKEQLALVRFRVKRSVPFDVESAAVSYFAQPTTDKKVDVVVVMAPLEIVARYESPFRTAGWNPGLVTTSCLAALELASDHGLNVVAKLTGRTLTVLVRQKSVVKLVRCLELPTAELDDVAAVLLPTFVYMEDNLGGRPERLILCGFGAHSGETQNHFQEELGVEVETMRSALGAPGENNAGLLGYLKSIARNN
jgi:type IV pilus assembly protein PilM